MKNLLLFLSLLSLLFVVTPVSAASVNHGSSPMIHLKNGTSTNWGGYAVETNLTSPQSNAVSDVKGTWTVPAVSCSGLTHNTYSSAWIGIDGYSDGTVEQTGTEHDCVNGQAQYSVWYEMYPKFPVNLTMPIAPGNSFSADVRYVGNSIFSLTITNTTTGASFTTNQRSKGRRQSAEWIVEAPYSGGVLPLANFGTDTFSSSTAVLNGVPGTISSFANDPITMVNSSGGVKASVSALNATGDGFTMKWISE